MVKRAFCCISTQFIVSDCTTPLILAGGTTTDFSNPFNINQATTLPAPNTVSDPFIVRDVDVLTFNPGAAPNYDIRLDVCSVTRNGSGPICPPTTQSTTQSTSQSTTQSTSQSTTPSQPAVTTQSTSQSTTQSTSQSTTPSNPITTQSTSQSTTQSTSQSTSQSTTQTTTPSVPLTTPSTSPSQCMG